MRVWLISGCSSGFGHQLALEALARGDKVIATARNSSRLSSLKSAGAEIMELDLTSTASDITDFASKAISIHGQIDVLVNNAGTAVLGAVEELQTDDWDTIFKTNFFGHVYLTKALLPHMRERKSGTIGFISSVGAWVVFPGLAAYNATKAALSIYAETLAAEIAPLGVKICTIEPGYFRTSMPDNTQIVDSIDAYDAGAVGQVRQMVAGMQGKQPGDLAKGSRAIVDVLTGMGGREVPTRFVLGNDAMALVKARVDTVTKGMEEWKDVAGNTDVDGAADINAMPSHA